MVRRAAFTGCALFALLDAYMAFSSFQHLGDWHVSWGMDALLLTGVFVYLGWSED